jgi:hypothetical protein
MHSLFDFCGRSLRAKVRTTLRACPATSSGLVFSGAATSLDSFVNDVLVARESEPDEEEEDGSADRVRERVWSLSAGPSSCQSIPCCFLTCAKAL